MDVGRRVYSGHRILGDRLSRLTMQGVRAGETGWCVLGRAQNADIRIAGQDTAIKCLTGDYF